MRNLFIGLAAAAALGIGLAGAGGVAHADTYVDPHTGTVYTLAPAVPHPGFMTSHDGTLYPVPIVPPCASCTPTH